MKPTKKLKQTVELNTKTYVENSNLLRDFYWRHQRKMLTFLMILALLRALPASTTKDYEITRPKLEMNYLEKIKSSKTPKLLKIEFEKIHQINEISKRIQTIILERREKGILTSVFEH